MTFFGVLLLLRRATNRGVLLLATLRYFLLLLSSTERLGGFVIKPFAKDFHCIFGANTKHYLLNCEANTRSMVLQPMLSCWIFGTYFLKIRMHILPWFYNYIHSSKIEQKTNPIEGGEKMSKLVITNSQMIWKTEFSGKSLYKFVYKRKIIFLRTYRLNCLWLCPMLFLKNPT